MTKTTTPRKPRQRRPLPPVAGSVKLVQPIGTIGQPEQQTGEIEITSQTKRGPVTRSYYLTCMPGNYRLTGWNDKTQQVTVYDVNADCTSCDCGDGTYNAEQREDHLCKHCKGLKALIAAGKLPAITGPVEDKLARGDADECHADDEADYLADAFAEAEADAWHSQYDAA